MELHDHLYALGLQTGRDVFDDPERLRGLMASSGAPSAEVDLVVDAVRRGSYRGLLAALDSGIDPARAVEEAGQRLGRERGSDPGAAAWALAVLGFAVGRVGENDVRRHRGAAPVTPPSQAPTQLGSALQYPSTNPRVEQPPQQSQPQQPPPTPPYGQPAQPAYSAPQQPQQPYGQPGYGQQAGWSSPTPPPTKSRLPVLLGVGGTLLAIIVAVVLAIVIAGGGDSTDDAGDGDSSSPVSSGATSDPTSEVTSETSEPTTDPTTEVTTVDPNLDPDRVSDDAAAGYTTALLTFSSDFGKAGNKLQRATNQDDTRGAKAAGRDLRAAVYDFDLAVRDLDLAPVQSDVNTFLRVSGRMINNLDRIERTATSVLDVNIGVAGLPVTPYTNGFQDLADAIDMTRS